MSEGFICYLWEGNALTEAQFIAEMRKHGMKVIHTQPLPVFNEVGGVSGYMSEAYRIVGERLVKEIR